MNKTADSADSSSTQAPPDLASNGRHKNGLTSIFFRANGLGH